MGNLFFNAKSVWRRATLCGIAETPWIAFDARVLGIWKGTAGRRPLRRRWCIQEKFICNSLQPLFSMVEVGCPLGDKLMLRGLVFHGFHGVKNEEKKLGQKFLIDVDAWMSLYKAGESDSMTDTVSYTDIYRIIKSIVEGPSHNLLESVAHEIAMAIFKEHPQISTIRVKVGKPHVSIPGAIDYLGIEILRHNKKVSSS